jgi:hypothetical protein
LGFWLLKLRSLLGLFDYLKVGNLPGFFKINEVTGVV